VRAICGVDKSSVIAEVLAFLTRKQEIHGKTCRREEEGWLPLHLQLAFYSALYEQRVCNEQGIARQRANCQATGARLRGKVAIRRSCLERYKIPVPVAISLGTANKSTGATGRKRPGG
jgi:hypothetical protein